MATDISDKTTIAVRRAITVTVASLVDVLAVDCVSRTHGLKMLFICFSSGCSGCEADGAVYSGPFLSFLSCPNGRRLAMLPPDTSGPLDTRGLLSSFFNLLILFILPILSIHSLNFLLVSSACQWA